MSQIDKQTLRRQLRAKRRGLLTVQQNAAAAAVAARVQSLDAFQSANNIALYLANDGELSPEILLQQCSQLGKQCYLPVVAADQQMSFALYQQGARLQANQFGILEPLSCAPRIPAEDLDLVFMPLVGFDRSGARLGMGGGYYDRAFDFLDSAGGSPQAQGPKLFGLAHSLQEVERLEVASWDIPLDAIITELEVIDI